MNLQIFVLLDFALGRLGTCGNAQTLQITRGPTVHAMQSRLAVFKGVKATTPTTRNTGWVDALHGMQHFLVASDLNLLGIVHAITSFDNSTTVAEEVQALENI